MSSYFYDRDLLLGALSILGGILDADVRGLGGRSLRNGGTNLLGDVRDGGGHVVSSDGDVEFPAPPCFWKETD